MLNDREREGGKNGWDVERASHLCLNDHRTICVRHLAECNTCIDNSYRKERSTVSRSLLLAAITLSKTITLLGATPPPSQSRQGTLPHTDLSIVISGQHIIAMILDFITITTSSKLNSPGDTHDRATYAPSLDLINLLSVFQQFVTFIFLPCDDLYLAHLSIALITQLASSFSQLSHKLIFNNFN